MPSEAEAGPIRSGVKTIVRPNGVDQTTDILRAVAVTCFGPSLRLPERESRSVKPARVTAMTGGIMVIGGKYQIAGRGKSFHQKAGLRGAAMKAVREDDNRLFDSLVQLVRPYGHSHACEGDGLFHGLDCGSAQQPGHDHQRLKSHGGLSASRLIERKEAIGAQCFVHNLSRLTTASHLISSP